MTRKIAMSALPDTPPWGLLEAAIAIGGSILGSIVTACSFVIGTRYKLGDHGKRLTAAEKKIDDISLAFAKQPTRQEVFMRIDKLEERNDTHFAELGRRFDSLIARERTGRAPRS